MLAFTVVEEPDKVKYIRLGSREFSERTLLWSVAFRSAIKLCACHGCSERLIAQLFGKASSLSSRLPAANMGQRPIARTKSGFFLIESVTPPELQTQTLKSNPDRHGPY